MISSTHASVTAPAPSSDSSSSISPSSTSTISPTGSAVQFVVDTNGQNYTYSGCYSDSAERILTASNDISGQVTVETCGQFCEGYQFFGVENGRECYCGDQIENGHGPINLTYCDYPCQEAPLELCGGSWALDLYQDEAFTFTTSSTTPSSSFTALMDPFSTSTSTSQAFTTSTSSVTAQSSSQLDSSSSQWDSSSSQLDSSSTSPGLSVASTSNTASHMTTTEPSTVRTDTTTHLTTASSKTKTTSTTTTMTTTTERPNSCSHDSCLRAFISFSAYAGSYCATFTTAVIEGTATAGVPTWATACSYSASRLSTACSCLASITTFSTTTTSTPV
jgi:hypothetical protein